MSNDKLRNIGPKSAAWLAFGGTIFMNAMRFGSVGSSVVVMTSTVVSSTFFADFMPV